jgi:hypothetical protein
MICSARFMFSAVKENGILGLFSGEFRCCLSKHHNIMTSGIQQIENRFDDLWMQRTIVQACFDTARTIISERASAILFEEGMP